MLRPRREQTMAQRRLAESRDERQRLAQENAALRAALDVARAWAAELGHRLVALDPDLDTLLEPAENDASPGARTDESAVIRS